MSVMEEFENFEKFQSKDTLGATSFDEISKNVDITLDKLLDKSVISSEAKSEYLKNNNSESFPLKDNFSENNLNSKDNINEKCELVDHYKSAHDNIAENQNVNKDGFETEDVEEIRNLAKYICNNK